MKKHFNKQLVMTKKDDEDYRNSTKCCICDNDCVDGNVSEKSLSYHWKI